MREIIESFKPGLFAGKSVLVSGGSSGIGLAIAQGFAAMGATVTATGTSDAKMAKARAHPDSRGISFAALASKAPASLLSTLRRNRSWPSVRSRIGAPG